MATAAFLEPTAVLCPQLAKVLTLDGAAVDGLGLVKRLENEVTRRAHAIWKSSGEQDAEKNWLAAERTLIITQPLPEVVLPPDLEQPPDLAQALDTAQQELAELRDLANMQKAQLLALQQALQARDQEVDGLKQQLNAALARVEPPAEPWKEKQVSGGFCHYAAELAPFWVLAEPQENLAVIAASAERLVQRGKFCSGAALAKAASAERLVDLRASPEEQPPVRERSQSEIERVKARLRRAVAQVRVANGAGGDEPVEQHFAVRLQRWRSMDTQLVA
mmetsp:Transcript_83747/g.194829  ORF Transcript_83747/g.194829 Transcript_83747/m.194829 type:complete len:277 (-) Transcript_83747:356-1186(-)